MTRISEDCVVRILDSFPVGCKYWMVLEKLEIDLKEWRDKFDRYSITLPVVREVTRQLLEALVCLKVSQMYNMYCSLLVQGVYSALVCFSMRYKETIMLFASTGHIFHLH